MPAQYRITARGVQRKQKAKPSSASLRLGALGMPLAFAALPLDVLLPHHYAAQLGVPLAGLGAAAQKLDLSRLSLFGPQASKFKYDDRMVRAAEIASARARSRSTRARSGMSFLSIPNF